MAWIGKAVGAVLGTAGTIISNVSGDKLRKQLGKAKENDPVYSESPYAKNRMALASNWLYGKSLGSVTQEQQIYGAQANQMSNISRNASDGSQALAMGAATLGQTDNAIQNKAIADAQAEYARMNNYNQASEGMTGEHTKSFDDRVRRWQDIVNIDITRHGIRQQQGQNMSNLGSMIGGMSFGGGGGGAKAGK